MQLYEASQCNLNKAYPKLLAATSVIWISMCTPTIAAESPYSFEFADTLDVMHVQSGGLKKGGGVLNNLDLTVTVDTEKAWNLRNGTAFLSVISDSGDEVNAINVGSTQGVDNIEAENTIKVYEAWYEQAFEHSTLRAGLYDLNSEFDSIDAAGLFINPSHGIGAEYAQSGQNGPSIFPTTSLAIRYASSVATEGYWQAAVLDGVPGNPNNPNGTHIKFNSGDGALIAVEGGVRRPGDDLIKHWGIGAWHYTEPSTENAAGNVISSTTNQGLYALVELGLGNDVTAYGRLGFADSTVNQISSYLGAGLVWSGIAGHEDDQLGFAVAIANNSSDYINATGSEDREIIWELTYRRQINGWLSIQPDIQYVQNPGTDPGVENALVAGARFEVSF